ncbi:MAG: 30S ribosome-binding factor RbfA [Candidatus Sumerlaeia bacterium]
MLHSRIKRVEELYQQELAKILAYEIRDPRVQMATATRVSVSKDLRDATVYVSLLGQEQEEAEEAIEALNAASGYIKHLLSERIVLKRLPHPRFKFDNSVEKAFEIYKVMDKIEPVDSQASNEHTPPGENESES